MSACDWVVSNSKRCSRHAAFFYLAKYEDGSVAFFSGRCREAAALFYLVHYVHDPMVFSYARCRLHIPGLESSLIDEADYLVDEVLGS